MAKTAFEFSAAFIAKLTNCSFVNFSGMEYVIIDTSGLAQFINCSFKSITVNNSLIDINAK